MDTVIAVVIPIVTAFCTVASFVIGRVVATKKESKNKGQAEGEIKADMEYIKSRLDGIERKQDSIASKLEADSERITRTEESVRQAHKRIDRLDRQNYMYGGYYGDDD